MQMVTYTYTNYLTVLTHFLLKRRKQKANELVFHPIQHIYIISFPWSWDKGEVIYTLCDVCESDYL